MAHPHRPRFRAVQLAWFISLVLTAGLSPGRAVAANGAEDGVLAPGALEQQRPQRRLVGRKLAADSPLAPGSVTASKATATTTTTTTTDGDAVLAPDAVKAQVTCTRDRCSKRPARKR